MLAVGRVLALHDVAKGVRAANAPQLQPKIAGGGVSTLVLAMIPAALIAAGRKVTA
jgi:hypothetical protein